MTAIAHPRAHLRSSQPLIDRVPEIPSPLRWLRRRFARRPGSTAALGLAALLGGAITVNALALQTERHPAPMFTALAPPVDPVATTAAVQSATVPEPPSRPAVAPRRAEPAPQQPAARTRPARESEPVRQAAAAPPAANARDQLNALFRTSAGPVATPEPARTQQAEPARQEGSERILLVQRALNRLGYGPLKVDGDFGAASRQAMERFEQDRRLAVRGEPMGRSLRELSRASGLSIE